MLMIINSRTKVLAPQKVPASRCHVNPVKVLVVGFRCCGKPRMLLQLLNRLKRRRMTIKHKKFINYNVFQVKSSRIIPSSVESLRIKSKEEDFNLASHLHQTASSLNVANPNPPSLMKDNKCLRSATVWMEYAESCRTITFNCGTLTPKSLRFSMIVSCSVTVLLCAAWHQTDVLNHRAKCVNVPVTSCDLT